MNSFKGQSSVGFDEIPAFLVKHCLHYLKTPITHVFNISVNAGIFSDLMNIAKIRPVLSVFSKTLEKIMYHRLLSFLKKFNILADVQNGFRDSKSNKTACHTFTENIQRALDKNVHVVGIFLDLSKACDVINRDILLYKLESYSVRCNLNLWFNSYLSQCMQFVSLTQTDYTNFMLNRYLSSSKVTL